MPTKGAPTHIEHNVYLTSSVTFDNKDDDFGRLQIYQAFSSLDEANQFCEAKADEIALSLDIEAPEPTLDNYTKDGTFRMELPLKHRNRDVTVETIIVPLMGGIIEHNKPVSRKTPKSKQALKYEQGKPKAKKSQNDDDNDEGDDDQDVDMDDDPVSSKTSQTTTQKPTKRKSTKASIDPESIVVTEADIAAAPSGIPDCLKYGTCCVFGHHEYWSEEQIKVIIRRFGGTVKNTLPVYSSDDIELKVVLGDEVPGNLLRRIKQKEFKTITPNDIITRIRMLKGPEGTAQVSSEEVAKLCKMVPGKPTARERSVKKEE